MSKEIQSSWMFSPKSFIRLLGAEFHLMRDAGVLKRFYISSLLILIILMLTWVSIEYALDLLFHTIAVEITLAIFFCVLFFCIYIFLLNTFAKENRKQKGILNFSNVVRIGFVAFMGFLIAQPLIVLLYTVALSPAVELHKQQVLSVHSKKINALLSDETRKLLARQEHCRQQKEMFATSIHDSELKKIAGNLNMLENKTAYLNQTAQQTIEHNSFFLFRVQTVIRKYPLSWLLTLLIVLLFLLPGYLIYTISSQHVYYILKKSEEKEIISKAYKIFSIRYKRMFSEELIIFSRYEDPPFNTIRKQQPVPASMKQFLQKYLYNG